MVLPAETPVKTPVDPTIVAFDGELLANPLTDVNKKDFFGRTPLLLCCADAWNDACQILFNDPRVNVNLEDVTYISVIARLVSRGDFAGVKALVNDKHRRLEVNPRDLNPGIYKNREEKIPRKKWREIRGCIEIVEKYHSKTRD